MRQLYHFLLAMLLLLALAATAHAEQVHTYTLKNGLKIFVKKDTRAPVVVSMVWYKVGSAYEPRGLTGISHVLEHMMFKGTKKYGPGVVARLVAENGGQENAFTNRDYTAYYQELAADKLELSFKIESDRMHNLLLREQDFKKELQVVKEERYMRVDDVPQSLTYERFNASAFLANPYHHPIIGWQQDLDNLTLENVEQWYQHHYGPNNAILVVVGDVDPQHVFKLAQHYFGPLQTIKVPTLKPAETIPPLGVRKVNVHVPAKLPWIIMGYNVPVVTSKTPEWEPYALDVLAAVLDGGNSTRLAKNIVRGEQIASDASADYSAFSLFPNLFLFEGTPAQNHTVDDLQKAFLSQINDLKNNLISQQELDRVKTQAIAQKTYDQDSIIGQAMQIGALESIGLSWKLADDYVENIKKVTALQVQAVAKKYLSDDRLTIGVLHPLPLDAKAANKQPTQLPLGGSNVH